MRQVTQQTLLCSIIVLMSYCPRITSVKTSWWWFSHPGFEEAVEFSSTTSLAGSQLESTGEWLTWSLLERVKSPEQPLAIKFTPMRYWVLCFLTRLCLMCCTTLLSPASHREPSTAEWHEQHKDVIIMRLLWSPWSTLPLSKRHKNKKNCAQRWAISIIQVSETTPLIRPLGKKTSLHVSGVRAYDFMQRVAYQCY